jgi:nucleoside-diphosphate-sugar epimerase
MIDIKTACVTGATGNVGQYIVKMLVDKGYRIKMLSRRPLKGSEGIEVIQGDIKDHRAIGELLNGCRILFHCAAEISQEEKMFEVNVVGTEKLIEKAKRMGIKYLCYLSSAGVVGKTDRMWVEENTPCNPQNIYEKSKWEAEQIVTKGVEGCNVVILRPTDVIDDKNPGTLIYPMRNGWMDKLHVFIKGGECAHIVHAEDVAASALYFMDSPVHSTECYFVSCDHDIRNTISGLWSLYRAIQKDREEIYKDNKIHLPIIIPYLLRRLWRGSGNYGNVRYSSEKLLSTGFRYRLGVEGAVRRIVSSQHPMNA